jgi:hypothetical protein
MIKKMFHENFDHCQMLRNDPPAWIIWPAQRTGSAIPSTVTLIPKGEQKAAADRDRDRDRAQRARPSSTASTPAASSSAREPVTESTEYPLFAYSPNLPASSHNKWPGQLLFHIKKTLQVNPPSYGNPATNNTKAVCFNFSTEKFCKCDGTHKGAGAKKVTCNRIHLCLGPSNAHASDPAEYFLDIVRFLKNPKVADYFVPTDAFATSKQYLDAVALL